MMLDFRGLPVYIETPQLPKRHGYYAQEYGKRRWRPAVRKRTATMLLEEGTCMMMNINGRERLIVTRAGWRQLQAFATAPAAGQ